MITNDSRHWLDRLTKAKNDRGAESPNYWMQMAFKGKRMSFALGTGNKEAKAAKARDIYLELLANGAEATVAKHRPQKAPATEVASVGDWITQAKSVFAGGDLTFGQYARCLRSMASDMLSQAKTKKRFSKAGAKAFRAEIDAATLDIFSPESVQAWRIRFVQRAGNNPPKQRAARIPVTQFCAKRVLYSRQSSSASRAH